MDIQRVIVAASTAITSGQDTYAEQICRTALAESPQDENLLLLLALSLQGQNRTEEAVEAYAQLTTIVPRSSLHWNNYATALAGSGALIAAKNAYLEAIRLDSTNVVPRAQLGSLLIGMGDPVEARCVLVDALTINPASPLLRIRAARACCICQDMDGAAQLLEPWRSWMPLHDDALQLELAQVLVQRNEVPSAAELLEDLVSRKPLRSEVVLLLSSVYERLNRLSEAAAMLPLLAEMLPRMSREQCNEIEHLRATLASRSQDFDLAREILEKCGPQGADDYAHYFQLATIYDKSTAFEDVMPTLATAHKLEVRERRFAAPAFFEPGSPAMPGTVLRTSAEQYARWPKLIAPTAADSPIMIVGFPRSGTTLLEQMLDAHPALQSMDENPFFNSLAGFLAEYDPRITEDLGVLRQYDCDELRKRYHAMVSKRIGRREGARLVDKNPLNMQWLPMISRLFPASKIIVAVRHPCDVILSCYMQSFRSMVLVAACSTLERLAQAYVQTMSCWLEQVEVFQPAVLVSRYEDLVGDFSNRTTELANFLQLEDPAPLMAFDRHARQKSYIATPSYSQVIEPINTKAVGRWHNYREAFEPLLPILEPILRHWGYPVTAGGAEARD